MLRTVRHGLVPMLAAIALLAAMSAATAATRILTLTLVPATTQLSAIYFNGLPAQILSSAGDLTFARVEDGGAGFECRNSIALVTVTGRTASARIDVCESNWQATFDLRDTGAGPSLRRVTVTPVNPELRILSLALDGAPQPFTAYPETNRIEFDIRRTPSGFLCARQMQALLSNGRSYFEAGDLCANDYEVIIDDRPVSWFEVLTVHTAATDRIVAVSIDGGDVSIYSSIADGVKVRVFAGPDGIACQVQLGARFASGAIASRNVNLCDANWDITLNPTRSFETDRSYGAPRVWQHVPSGDAGVPTRLIYIAPGRQPAFEARCVPGTATASLYFSGFLSGTVSTSRPLLAFEAGTHRGQAEGRLGTLPGTTVGNIPAIDLRTSSSLWNGMIAGTQLVIVADNRHRIAYSLASSANPVRAFLANCNSRPRVFGPTVFGDVSGDVRLRWIFTPGASSRQPRLVFGDPATGRLGFEVTCVPASGVTEATFHSVPARLPPDQQGGIGWDILSRAGFLPSRTVLRPGIDWGAVAFSRIGFDHSFYSAIIAGSVMRVSYNGTPVATWSLRASGAPTRAFIDACRPQFIFGGPGGGSPAGDAFQILLEIFAAIQATSGGDGAAEGSDPAAEALAAYQAQPNFACAIERTLTRAGGLPVEAVFTNGRFAPVWLFVIDSAGNRQFVATVGPGGSVSVPGRVNQGWVVTDPFGNCLTTFASPRSRTELQIRPEVEQPDPDVYARSYVCESGDQIAVIVEPNRGKVLIAGEFPMQFARDDRGERYVWGTSGAFIEETVLRVVADGVPRLVCDAIAG